MMQVESVTIGGVKIPVEPENYSTFLVGRQPEVIPTSNGYFVKPGYLRRGFRASGLVLDANLVGQLQQVALNQAKSGDPISASTPVDPASGGGWSGFVEINTPGKANYNGNLPNIPNSFCISNVEITFTNVEAETE